MAMEPAYEPRSGRPSREEVRDLYESLPRRGPAQLLDVPLDAEPARARSAFLALARRFHPDALDPADADLSKQAQAIFIALDEACRHFGGHLVLSQRTAAPDPAPPPLDPGSPAPVEPDPTPDPAQAPERVDADLFAARRADVAEALDDAENAIGRGDAEAAVDLLHEVRGHAEDRDRPRIRLLLARAYLADPRWRRNGLALLREMTEGPAPDSRALALLGGFYHREGLLARAEAMLSRALAADPGEREVRFELRRVRTRLAERPAPSRPTRRTGLLKRLLAITR